MENHRGNAAEVIIFPPFPFLHQAVTSLDGSGIAVGCQTCSAQQAGAYTGEVAPSMIQTLGCQYVLVGHSERRSLFGESDAVVNTKVRTCLEQTSGLQVILCVGETLEEYEADLMASTVDVQLRKALLGIGAVHVRDRLIVAYEPVWAIGTGKTATPAQAQVAHAAVRSTIRALYGGDVADLVPIQYGGSVNPDNVEQLMLQPDVDGALVGGASLSADSFTRVIDGACSPSMEETTRRVPPRVLTATEAVPCANVLGESPVWSVRDQALYWISAPEEEIWTWNLRDAPYRRLVGTTVGCTAILQGRPHSLLVAGESAFLTLQMQADSGDFAAGPAVLCERPEQDQCTRPNDGRVDRQGRMVFGMYNNYHREGASGGENNAGLYRLNANLELESLLDYKYRVSNCICFPADGTTMFFCDTPTRKVYAFDYPQGSGETLSNRRVVWMMPPDWSGGPDGAQVDADGCIWMAISGAHRVVRVNPSTGRMDYVVHLPVLSPTSCTFGGPELDELFITTRKPDGGGLYRVKMPFGIRGLPEPEFHVEGPTVSSESSPASTFPERQTTPMKSALKTADQYAGIAEVYKSMTKEV